MTTWADDIAFSLRLIGGESELCKLYLTVGLLRGARGDSVPEHFRSVIRQQLQFDSRFVSTERGRWRLRKRRAVAS